MSDHHIPALRRRFLEDMRIKGLLPKTQTMYLRAMREFTRFLGHSPDAATPEELRAFLRSLARERWRGVSRPAKATSRPGAAGLNRGAYCGGGLYRPCAAKAFVLLLG